MNVRVYTKKWYEILDELRTAKALTLPSIGSLVVTRQGEVDGASNFSLDALEKKEASFRTASIYTCGAGQLGVKIFGKTLSPDHYLVFDLAEIRTPCSGPLIEVPVMVSVLHAFWFAQKCVRVEEGLFGPRIGIPRELHEMFSKLGVQWESIDGWVCRSVSAAAEYIDDQRKLVTKHCKLGASEIDPSCFRPLWKRTDLGRLLDSVGLW